MSDSDDIPELVSDDDSSEEEEVEEQHVMHAAEWLERDKRVLERQDVWFRVFCLGPYLYGVDKILPNCWIQALTNADLVTKDRPRAITYLKWQEWDCLDLMDQVVLHVQKQMRDKPVLAQALRCVQLVDSCITGQSDDVDRAISCAAKVHQVNTLWTSLLKKLSWEKETNERATKFAVLYAIKIYSEHVLKFDFVDGTKKILKKNISGKTADELKREGNNFFKNQQLDDSIKCYTEAAKKDPFHHVYYGNRAQAYNKLYNYMEALADGRRAVTIRPDFAKGYYRYAVAFHELGRLDSAISVIESGISQCQKVKDIDVSNLNELKSLEQIYAKKKIERNSKHGLTPIPKVLDEHLEAIPTNCFNSVDLDTKFGTKKPTIDRLDDDVSQMISSGTEPEFVTKTAVEVIVNGRASKAELKKEMEKDHKINNEEERLKKFEERRLEVEAKKAEAEERKKKEEEERKRRREEEVRELTGYVSEGSDLMLQGVPGKRAMASYQKALDMLQHYNNIEDLGMDESDLVTLKYAHGMAAISTGLHKNILEAVEKFEEILELHQEVRFPPAYYGLAMAYVTLNRFPEAMDYVKNGLKVASNIRYATTTWPGSKALLEESEQKTLLVRLEALLQQCKFPPQPDAVCRCHTDEHDSRTVIYLSDPDFKGYVKIMCQMDCIITFHTICWKTYKTESNKQIDKDMLDTDCPTPDCNGLVIKIEIIRQDSLSNKEHISERFTELKEAHRNKAKPSTKQKPGEAKQARKHEKKEVRKQKKQQRHLGEEHHLADEGMNRGETTEHAKKSAGIIQDGASAMAFIDELKMEDGAQPLPDVKDTVAYKKEEPVYKEKSSGKVKKSKKKKEKSKQIINLEVNFSDRKEETLSNENSAIIDGNTNTSVGAPFSVPSDLQSQISTFEKSYAAANKPHFKPDEVTENLFSFFVDILSASGPLAIDDQKIQQELDVFPVEAMEKIRSVGGLADFLRQSLKFAVIDDVVSLMKDAVSAREYALKRRNKHSKEGGSPVTQSAWQTVGKNPGLVDSLSESVKSKTSADVPVVSPSSVNTKHPGKETGASQSGFINSSPSFPSTNLATNTQTSLPAVSQNGLATITNKSVPTVPQESVATVPKQPAKAWSSFVRSPADSLSEQRSSGINALDSIEDTPVESQSSKVTKQLDDLDDFDYMPVSGSDNRKLRVEACGRSHSRPRDEDALSNSSSRSDLSDKSLRSDFSTDHMPRPLRPLGTVTMGKGGMSGARRPGMWDKLESDFDLSWGQTRQEEFTEALSPGDSVTDELQQAANEFVRKSDEKFVSELAESVVNKLYTGKKVSVEERQKTLKNVSAEIWKDFERSASTGTTFGGNIWANTPAGAAYSANMGQFANDFMKKHYETFEDGIFSDQKTFYSKPISPLDTFNSTKNSSGFSSPISPSWNVEDRGPSKTIVSPAMGTSKPVPLVVPPTSTSAAPTTGGLTSKTPVSSYSGGYNLFSGPTWGLDSFNKPTMPSTHPNYNVPPPHFIRPPHPATSFYQSPPVSLRPEVPPFQHPFPLHHPASMPHPKQPKVEKKDVDIQCSVVSVSVETMTEPYEPNKQEYNKMQEERDQALQLMMETKAVYERLVQQYKAKEQQIKLVESQLSEEIHKCAVEKKQAMEEREALTGDIHQLQDRLNKQAHAEKELREKMSSQEQRVNEIAKLAKEQREKDLGEIKRYKEVSDGIQQKYTEQLERARAAEIDILKSHLTADKARMARTQKESSFHEQHLATFIKKHQEENKPIPPQLQASYDYWHLVQTKMDESIKKVQVEYESRIEEVRGGRLLSDIQPVRIPSPPPIPDYVRSALKSMMGQQPPVQGMSGYMVPRMPGPGGASSPAPMSHMGAPISSFPALPSSAPTALPSRPQADLRPQTTVATPAQVPPRPLSGARAPLSAVVRAPLKPLGGGTAAGQTSQMSSFEKLMQKLHALYPKYSRSDFTGMIQELRTECGGSLSGMTMDDIVCKIGERVSQHTSKPTISQANPAHKPSAQAQPSHPPGLSPIWAFPRGGSVGRAGVGAAPARGSGGGGGEVFEDEEDPCVICHEEMEPTGKATVTLECNHAFHDECIRKWFQEQSTCPNCRVHTLLADEFPSLG